ncbi:unnamed protein product [Paramecium octaurelia]|uniref:Uncharacterized protein n=1 Tax=Paramecium octaurelia TaxID=43137 RepID=A0A8S1WN80_PAROT|nr:unnamed protein product [Paramecium octaurelia]
MLSLSQHSLLVLTDDRQINYFQDQILFWQYMIPSNVDIEKATMRYSHMTYLVQLISNQVYRFNPYDKIQKKSKCFLTITLKKQNYVINSYLNLIKGELLFIITGIKFIQFKFRTFQILHNFQYQIIIKMVIISISLISKQDYQN